MDIPSLFNLNGSCCYCPICKRYFLASDYLREAIVDDKVRFIANNITHYRHTHITSWNKCWGRMGGYYRAAAKFGNYEEEKHKVNERAKRQIIRKAKDYLIIQGITSKDFCGLQHNDNETLALAEKFLDSKNVVLILINDSF